MKEAIVSSPLSETESGIPSIHYSIAGSIRSAIIDSIGVYLTANARAYNTGPKHSLLGQLPPGGEALATVSIYIDSSNTGDLLLTSRQLSICPLLVLFQKTLLETTAFYCRNMS